MADVRLPDFLVIGAAKSGTTAVYHYLRQHPDIFMSAVKEPMYFAYADAAPDTQGPGDFAHTAVTDWDAYVRLFADAIERLAGEASPVYLYDAACAERIKKTLPDVKLIVVLRNPAERAWSAYLHKRRNGVEVHDDFMTAIQTEPERIAANWGPLWHYTRVGMYAEQLACYFEQFSREQIGIWLHDDLRRDTAGVMQQMFGWLGIDDRFVPDVSLRMNVSGRAKNERLHNFYNQLFGRDNPIKGLAQKMIPEAVRVRVTTQLRNRNMERVAMPEEARDYLNELYRPEIMRLQNLIEQDVSHWLA